nr:alkaline phosphatase family protein [Gammaproteobacteria bacterium]
MNNQATSVSVNERDYLIPQSPAVVICLDGCEPAYLDKAIGAGQMPALEAIRRTGSDHLAHSAIPSFTNPNNMSIATGRPPAIHGICGNYLFNPETGDAVMMNDPVFLRAPTVFSRFQQAGARVAIVTAKDKLRTLLGHELDCSDGKAICFSSERSSGTTLQEHGIENAAEWLGRPVPEVYSADLSEFVFAAGVRLLESYKPDVMYLTTTDYVQHKYAPDDADAIEFYAMFDRYLAQLHDAGATIVITADHGMKPKHLGDGSPAVVYLQDYMNQWLGE